MGFSVSLSNTGKRSINPVLFAAKPTGLVAEIELFRQETARLERVYDLHRKLGEALDLDAMLEAFSRWLSPIIPHDLVAFRHYGRRRMPTACSCHGPYRKQLIESALTLFEEPVGEARSGSLDHLGKQYQIWSLGGRESEDFLLVIHSENEQVWQQQMVKIEDILEDLRGPIERALVYEDLYEQARRDALTGLDNRRVFLERAKQEMISAERYGASLILACLDLDHFKSINDKLGHGEGDRVLKRVSEEFLHCVRDSDILARIGGDEFAMILPNTSLENAKLLMNRICHAVRDLAFKAPGSEILGVSIGLAAYPPAASLESWWVLADEALYRAKNNGRCQVST